MHGINRNFPDTEEAQNMVNAVGIEIFRHILETAYPPGTVVLQHLIPVIGGEAPVLTVGRERIGRRTSLSI